MIEFKNTHRILSLYHMEWLLFLHLQSSRIRLFQIFHLRRSSSSVAFLIRKWQSMYRIWYIFLLCPGAFLKILYFRFHVMIKYYWDIFFSAWWYQKVATGLDETNFRSDKIQSSFLETRPYTKHFDTEFFCEPSNDIFQNRLLNKKKKQFILK